MKRTYFLLFLISILVSGCQEDADKVISTDLPQEALQMFDTSKAWSESLYFGLLTFEEYLAMDSTSILPGCPSLLIEQDTKKVILDFDSENPCDQAGDYSRSGKLILEFSLSNIPTSNWAMSYDQYVFEGDTIRGIRNFSSKNSNEILEMFNPLTIKTQKSLTTKLTGSLTHRKAASISNSIGIMSGGTMTGVNAVGREFEIEIPFDRLMLSSCFQKNELIPVAGTENWTVARGSNKQVSHQLTYELIDSCQVAANVRLPDGRHLLLNP
ncbi:hypothetical protein JYB64_10915 [Algoriphagus aestuarii]|nr:hypothetical protein [Algoriphagus aestuarii]